MAEAKSSDVDAVCVYNDETKARILLSSLRASVATMADSVDEAEFE
jgi:hypothetical protein